MHSPVGIILVEAAAMRIDNASNIGIEGLTIGYPLADPLSEAIAATGRPPPREVKDESIAEDATIANALALILCIIAQFLLPPSFGNTREKHSEPFKFRYESLSMSYF